MTIFTIASNAGEQDFSARRNVDRWHRLLP